MNRQVKDYFHEFSDDFSPSGHFHKVISLHDSADITWEFLYDKVPDLGKGWFELSRLPPEDRVEFTRDYWLTKLPYIPHVHDTLLAFFSKLEDVGVFITQKTFEDPYEVQLVYSLEGDAGFYHGSPPCTEMDVYEAQKNFGEYTIPADFAAFLQIHNGFSKYTDTGVLPLERVLNTYEYFQEHLSGQDIIVTIEGEIVNPKGLIPFYESFGMHSYQCFWGDWYPDQEMGNVYYSGASHSISEVHDSDQWSENLAFPTFLDWLAFYLEGIE